MATDKSCAFRFKSDIITNGNWSAYMFCTVDTFKRWFDATRRLNECAIAEYSDKYQIISAVNVHIARTDRTYCYQPETGWRDATDDPPHDIKQQPTAATAAYLGDGQDHTPTDAELYGGAAINALQQIGKPVWFIFPITSGLVEDCRFLHDADNERHEKIFDLGYYKNRFVDTIDYSAEGLIG